MDGLRAARSVMGPRLFYPLRRVYVVSRYYLGRLNDKDFLFIRNLGPNSTLVDVGANAGQSALSMALLSPSSRIVSFEANADNLNDLRFVGRILGRKYEFYHTALSDVNGLGLLKMPIVGIAPVPGESSLEDYVFHKYALKQRIGEITRIERQQVSLTTLDSYGIEADFIKIDVQGHELSVMRGAVETIRKHRPVCMIESNADNFFAIRDLLNAEGYEAFGYNPHTNTLSRSDKPTTRNYFALHECHVRRFAPLLRGCGAPVKENLFRGD
jgi:FkbM family methyltransferase